MCVCVCVCVHTHKTHERDSDRCATAHGRRDSNTCDSDTCDSNTCATAETVTHLQRRSGRRQAPLARLPSLCLRASMPEPRAAAVSSLFFSSLFSLAFHRPTHTSKSTCLSAARNPNPNYTRPASCYAFPFSSYTRPCSCCMCIAGAAHGLPCTCSRLSSTELQVRT